LGLAPFSNKNTAALILPLKQAIWSGVLSFYDFGSGFALLSKRICIISTLSFSVAK